MSVRYEETFKVLGTVYGIERCGPKAFQLWSGGCSIGTFTDKTSARARLHEFIKRRVDAMVSSLTAQLTAADQAQAKLGDDPFNLGRFMEEDKG